MLTLKPKKVTFIINSLSIGGVERLLLDIIYRLDKDKFDISIITVFGSGPLESNFQKLGVKIYFAAGKFPSYKNRLLYKAGWLIISPVVLARLIWQLRKLQPSVAVSSLYHADILGMLAAYIVGIRERIVIHHDMYKLEPIRAWLKRNISIRLATTIVAVSSSVKDFLVDYFMANPNQIRIIRNGIILKNFKVNNLLSHYSSLSIGMLGRLEPVKDPLTFLNAIRIIQGKYKNITTSYIGGGGSLKKKVVSFIQSAGLINLNIDGEIKNVPEWLNKIDILVAPSLSEGFGLVVLEGLSSGKIVVASDIPAVRELIKDGDNGYLFKVQDTFALAKILHQLTTDKNFYEQAKQRVLLWQNHSLFEYDISKTVQFYDELLSKPVDQDSNGEIRP